MRTRLGELKYSFTTELLGARPILTKSVFSVTALKMPNMPSPSSPRPRCDPKSAS